MINVLSFHTDFIDPPALRLVYMMDQVIRRCIDAWKNDDRCTEVLTLGRLPPRQQQQPTDQGTAPPDDQQGQPANQPAHQPIPSTSETGGTSAQGATGATPQPSTSGQDQPRQPTEEELARNAIDQKVLDATLNSSATEVDGVTPSFNDSLRKIDLQFNQDHGYSNVEGIIRYLDFWELNGGFVPLTTQQKGACLFHAFRKSIICPREFTNIHLRRMMVSFICHNLDFLHPMLRLSIAGNYGHLMLSRAEYEDLRDRNLLTPQQREEYLEPGPFSVINLPIKPVKVQLLWRRNCAENFVNAISSKDFCPE